MPSADRPHTGTDVAHGPGLGAGALVVVAGAGTVYGAAHSSNTAAILTFVGAILVALITWYATDRRQAAGLQAEQTRLVAQLEHDRRLNDRQHLRTFLEEAATTCNDTMSTYRGLRRRFVKSLAPGLPVHERKVIRDMCEREHQALLEGMISMGALVQRTMLRFPTEHPVWRELDGAMDAMYKGHQAYKREAQDPSQRAIEMKAHQQAASKRFYAFASAVRDEFAEPRSSTEPGSTDVAPVAER